MRIMSLSICFCLLAASCFAQAKEGEHYLKLDNPKEIVLELSLGVDELVEEYRHRFIYEGMVDSDINISINFSERGNYIANPHDPGDNGFRANPKNYRNLRGANLRDYAKRVYRSHYSCAGVKNENIHNQGNEIIELEGGYENHIGVSRFYNQCILDGSFDGFYDEVYDYGTVNFKVGETKSAFDFDLTVVEANGDKAIIKIAYTGQGRYSPTGEDLEGQAVEYLERTHN